VNRDDYLWDRSGPVDLELERLERELRPLALATDAEEPDWRRVSASRFEHGRRRRGRWAALAAGVALAAAGASAWWALAPRGPAWTVESLVAGAAIDGAPVSGRALLRRGQTLTTGGDARVRVGIEGLGSVEVEPDSELEMVRATPREHRMRLAVGTIHALILAPPRRFAVDTPAAEAIDLGCAYSLTVGAGGEGRLRVDSGWVALVGEGRESFLPSGSSARIVAGRGPGSPVWDDAPLALAVSVETLDGDWQRRHLDAVLVAARGRDALTLWHLLARAPEADRPRLAARLAAAVPPPGDDVLAGALAGDRAALDAWWQALGLGSSSWWRLWRQPAPLGAG
jgi:hypothetical protein